VLTAASLSALFGIPVSMEEAGGYLYARPDRS
jgi:hypothetical protein